MAHAAGSGRAVDRQVRTTTDGRAEPSNPPVELGRRIRELRLLKKMSGRALAQKCGVSSGFISQVESDDTTPSVANLVKIAQALEVQVGDLFAAPRPVGNVLRREERQPYEYPAIGVVEERLCVHPQLEVVIVTLAAGGSTGPDLYTHGTEVEFVHVLEGDVVIVLGEEDYPLSSGDSVRFPGEVPHGCRNDSERVAKVIWAITPGLF